MKGMLGLAWQLEMGMLARVARWVKGCRMAGYVLYSYHKSRVITV